jgi:NDP-sugar pyrophosphorylase family protein
VGDDTVISNSVVLEQSRIGSHARITDSLIGEKCRIGDHAQVGPDQVLGGRSVLAAYSLVGQLFQNNGLLSAGKMLK